MNDSNANNPNGNVIISGTKEVAENLKFNESGLQEWFGDSISSAGKILKIAQFKGGQSNPTYKITTEKQQFVLRRKPPGILLPSAHAVDREYKVITALQQTEVPVPKTYGLCEDEDVIGTPFFVMDFLDGNIYWDLLLGDKSPAERSDIYASKNNVIAQLHMVDYESVGLSDYGKPGNYIARQVSRWTKQYIASETQNIPAMNNLIDWLPSNIPDEDETSIITALVGEIFQNLVMKNSVKKMAFQLRKNTEICILKLLVKILMNIGSFIQFLISLNLLEFCRESWGE